MPTILTAWGIIVTLQGTHLQARATPYTYAHITNKGLVSSYGGLVAVRAILGLVEGPMFPGIVLYLSGFYTRRDLSLRSVADLPPVHVILT